MLLRDKIEKFELTRRRGQEARADRRALAALQPRASRSTRAGRTSLQAEFGHETVDFLPSRRSSTTARRRIAGVKKLVEAADPEEEPFETELVAANDGRDRDQGDPSRERARAHAPALRGAVQVDRVPAARRGARASSSSRSAGRRSRSRSATSGARRDSFGELRQAVLDLAKEGISLQRFKGLGEMDAEELRETTMDPRARTLQRVTIEDAATRGADVRRPDGRQASSRARSSSSGTRRRSGSSMSESEGLRWRARWTP